MSVNIKKGFIAWVVFCLLLLAGCETTPLYNKYNNNVDQMRSRVKVTEARYGTPPPVRELNTIYADHTPLQLTSNQPSWMNKNITIRGNRLPFSFYVNRITTGSPVAVGYANDINASKIISIDYSGTVKGALDALGTKTGYSYQLNNNSLTWSNLIARTFDISFMPGSTNYQLGGQAKADASPGNTNAVYFGDLGNTANEYSNMGAVLSIWKDLRATLNDLKSKDGKVVVSEATTTVTVYDHPTNIAMMAKYLNQLNSSLSRQVALQVQVLEVELNKDFNYGVNWNLVRSFGNLSIGVAGNLAQPVALTPIGGNIGSTAGFIMNSTQGVWNGTNFLINALKQQGKVTVATEPRVVTLNNQVAEIGISQLQGYLESVSTTFTGTNADSQTETLNPGIIKTGFSLYILPKVKGKNVYLQISSDLSRLRDIQKISSRQGGSEIQIPTITEKIFNQRSEVPSGSTLVVAGFKQISNQTGLTSMFNIKSGEGGSKKNIETIVLITPTILG